MQSQKELIKKAFELSLPIFTGYLFLGISFAILAVSNGFVWWLPIVMSIITYAGSMQFAAIPLILAPFNPGHAIFLAILINARHIFYGISLLEPYSKIKKHRNYMIFALTDETFSLISSLHLSGKSYPDKLYLYISILDHSYWVFGTIVGVILGNTLPFNPEGIDFVLTALFYVIFLEQWLEQKDYQSALIGLISSALCLIAFGEQYFMIPAMFLIILSFFFKYKKEEAK